MSIWSKLRGSDTRKDRAPRIRVLTLLVFYWNGAAPAPRRVRYLSSSGLYLYTTEVWYPGTLILIRLQREDCLEGSREHSIAVAARVVRRDEEGVGLEFAFSDAPDALGETSAIAGGASKAEFEWFAAQLKCGLHEVVLGTKEDRRRMSASGPA